MSNYSSSSWESSLTRQEVSAYKQLFHAATKSQPNVVTGMESVQFFAKSGLPNTVLSQIWETADQHNFGYLTQDTFAIALKLIACAQNHIRASEPLFSTVTPLPQMKGIQVTTSSGSSITPTERKKYQAIYQAQHPTRNGIPADNARNLFSKSRLPNDQLSQIWNLADIRKNGYLDETEFIIAMHYVAKLMDKSMPSFLPSILPPDIYLAASGGSPLSPPLLQSREKKIDSIGTMAFSNNVWDVTAHEKAQYDISFTKLDNYHKGIIGNAEAATFFKNSKLPDSDLAKICDLADIGHTGTLNKNEFAIAMHLIHARLTHGTPLPHVLPRSLVPPTPGLPDVTNKEPDEDLLGDFGNNEQLTETTNQVNLLQNQITSTKKSTLDMQAQKNTLEQTLSVLVEKKDDLQSQVNHLKQQQESVSVQLQDLQHLVTTEQPQRDGLKQQVEEAELELTKTYEQVAEAKLELKQSQGENEKLRRSVHNIQMESVRLTKELDDLHALNKKKQEAAAARKAALIKKKQELEAVQKAEEERIAELKRQGEEEEAARKAGEERKILEQEAREAEEEARKAEEERKRLEEDARLAEQARKFEEERLAEEALKAEETRKAEEARLAEEERKAEETRFAEEARKVEEECLADEERKIEEALKAEVERETEDARIAEQARKVEEGRLAEETRLVEEAKKARKVEEARIAEEARKAEQSRRVEEDRLAAESRKAEEYRIVDELKKKQEEEGEEEKRVAKAQKEAAFVKAASELERENEEEEARLAKETEEAAALEKEKVQELTVTAVVASQQSQDEEDAAATQPQQPQQQQQYTSHTSHTEEDDDEGDDFFDAETNIYRPIHEAEIITESSNNVNNFSCVDENEFVMIDHPDNNNKQNEEIFTTMAATTTEQKPLDLTENHQTSITQQQPVLENKDKDEPVIVSSMPPALVSNQDFDAIFGPISKDDAFIVTPKEIAVKKGEKQGVVNQQQQERGVIKKKNIFSWAKSFGHKKDKKKKGNTSSSPSSSLAPLPAAAPPLPAAAPPLPAAAPPLPPTTSSLSSSAIAVAFGLDTIQGSHISELVNMGFEPSIALEALDRYDQDVEKATNYLLDQN